MIIGLVFGVRLSFGIFFEALTRSQPGSPAEFSWSRSDTAGVFSITMVVFALASTVAGWAVDRWGTRLVFITGILIVASGLFLTSRMTSLFHYYLYYGVWTGLGIAILGLAMHAATLSRWFDIRGRRGLAIGLAFSGTGVGIVILAPLIEQMITYYGWRVAYQFLSLIVLLIGLPLVYFLLRNRPEEMGLQPDGLSESQEVRNVVDKQEPTAGWTFGMAFRTPAFWYLMLGGACSLFTLRMVSVHQVAHLVDKGVPRLTAATILGGAGLVTAVAFVLFGMLSDRIGRTKTFHIGTVSQVIALVLLMTLPSEPSLILLYTYAIVWGLGEGGRSGLLTATAGDAFTGPSIGTIIGCLGAFFGVGSAIGSWLAGWLYDTSGSYVLAFGCALVASLVASLGMYGVVRHKEA